MTGPTPGGPSLNGPHALRDALRCQRCYWLGRLHRAGSSTYARIGSLFHLACAHVHAAQLATRASWEEPVTAGRETPHDALARVGTGFPAEIRLAQEFLRWYPAIDAARAWAPVEVEEETIVALGAVVPDCPADVRDHKVSCRPDLIARVNGSLWAVDHKTLKPRGTHLSAWDQRRMFAEHGWQAMTILHILRTRYPDLYGFAAQRIKRSMPFEADVNVLRVPALAYVEWGRAVVEAARRQIAALRDGPPPPNFAACDARAGLCDFIDVCQAERHEDRVSLLATAFTRRA